MTQKQRTKAGHGVFYFSVRLRLWYMKRWFMPVLIYALLPHMFAMDMKFKTAY